MDNDTRLSDINNLSQALYHLKNDGKRNKNEHGIIGARNYLNAVSSEDGLSDRIELIWNNNGAEAARLEVERLILELSR